MRFAFPVLTASLVAVAAGAVVDVSSRWSVADLTSVPEVVIKEHCRGMVHWSNEGFFRSGTTVRYHGHMWQCTKWSKGENPESSDTWQDLGACDPDVQYSQSVLAKRSSSIEARDANETSNCLGYVEWSRSATFRSGSTVKHGDHLWQTKHWVVKTEPSDNSDEWSIVAACENTTPKLAKRSCDGIRAYDNSALIRSGTTVVYKGEVYQASNWVKGVPPTDTKSWTHYDSC
ncbi:hypothetical protein BDV93DRAFT_603121 [Ceratobasidium sp. AG-I]|nr:hypothetical protein BDV93DRAFT_603121 [Ceratobasidium sp. AG-I]